MTHRAVGATIAERDRQHFDRIADRYGRKDLDPASRPARQLRLEQTMAVIPLSPSASLLDVGCGAGFAAEYLAGRYGHYTGIDYASELVSLARQHHSGERIRFDVADLADYQPPAPFDAALLVGVLHHFEDVDRMLAKLASLIVPGGWIVANEPQPANPIVHLLRRIRRRIDSSYSIDQVELDELALRNAYQRAGLTAIHIAPQGLLSTPFAEVPLGPRVATVPLVKLACAADRFLERQVGERLRWLSWNLIAAGRKPAP